MRNGRDNVHYLIQTAHVLSSKCVKTLAARGDMPVLCRIIPSTAYDKDNRKQPPDFKPERRFCEKQLRGKIL
jgi:hypothetical protein